MALTTPAEKVIYFVSILPVTIKSVHDCYADTSSDRYHKEI